MVKASHAAACQLAASPNIRTERPDNATPSPNAASDDVRPDGMGRDFVRRIIASISASHHIFKEPDAPPPMAMNKIAQKASTGCKLTGAAIKPTKAVNTTNDMTRGLSKAT